MGKASNRFGRRCMLEPRVDLALIVVSMYNVFEQRSPRPLVWWVMSLCQREASHISWPRLHTYFQLSLDFAQLRFVEMGGEGEWMVRCSKIHMFTGCYTFSNV